MVGLIWHVDNEGQRRPSLRPTPSDRGQQACTGEVTAIMGPSGAGKFTSLHCTAVLDVPTSGVTHLEDTNLVELSDGQQRMACARATVGEPENIFGDVPTGNLDSQSSHELFDILWAAVDETGRMVVTYAPTPPTCPATRAVPSPPSSASPRVSVKEWVYGTIEEEFIVDAAVSGGVVSSQSIPPGYRTRSRGRRGRRAGHHDLGAGGGHLPADHREHADIPWERPAVVLVAAILVGVVAALWPARRALRGQAG